MAGRRRWSGARSRLPGAFTVVVGSEQDVCGAISTSKYLGCELRVILSECANTCSSAVAIASTPARLRDRADFTGNLLMRFRVTCRH